MNTESISFNRPLSTPPAFDVPPPRTIGSVNWRGMWELYLKEVRRFRKVILQTIAAPAITGLMFLLVMKYAYGRNTALVAGYPFADFLVPGLVIMAMVQNAFANSSTSILGAKVQGNIVDVLMPPLSALELTIGWTLGGVTRGAVVGTATLVTMSPFADLHVYNLGLILFHGLAGCLMMSTVGVLSGIWAEKFDHMAAVSNFIVTPLTFLSGTFYTIDRLPQWAQQLARFNPFFYNIDGFRHGFLGHESSDPATGIAVITVVNAMLLIWCYRVVKSGYKLKA
ncbi:MAG: multidrug ABC transporter permease [Rhodospirillaceae bacterium]|nr:MAG: multidrug ABC transporter permease [Rhodospirillaceae bacterium]